VAKQSRSNPSTARRNWLGALWLLAFAAAIVWAIHKAWVGDDIYITFRYCDNVLAGHGPVYNPGERSEGYTHFLWFVLLTLGRALHVEPHLLGKYLPLPFFAGALLLLLRLSALLFPARGGLAGIPVAALGWAAHEDARLYGSSGLETSFYIFSLLLGFTFLCASSHRRQHALAGWAFAMATLARPDGILYSGFAALYVLWRHGRRALGELAIPWVALVLPLFVFRLVYYGYPFPNPYYAKSGAAANWPQGWAYLRTYFGVYLVLLAAPLVLWPLLRALRRPAGDRGDASAAAPALLFGLAAAAANIGYVTRMGGDFMFARFHLPATPFLLLAIEWPVHRLPRRSLRLAATAACVGLVLYGAVRKQMWFSDKRHVRSIVDEPQYYPDARLNDIRAMGEALARCIASTNAVIMVQGGQAALAYYGKFPVAIERYGLTDEHIAHGPTPPRRGRPGHEKLADAAYIYARRVNLRIHYRQPRSMPQYVQFGVPWTNGYVYGDVVVYDRQLMDRLKGCPGIRFLDFPLWLRYDYLPRIPALLPERVARDYNDFQRYYFEHNPDPEGLLAQLDAALAAARIAKQPPEPLRPDFFEDTGRTTLPGGV
jgi:arabinofuranosyltransferase